jgi:hypothetical protein
MTKLYFNLISSISCFLSYAQGYVFLQNSVKSLAQPATSLATGQKNLFQHSGKFPWSTSHIIGRKKKKLQCLTTALNIYTRKKLQALIA